MATVTVTARSDESRLHTIYDTIHKDEHKLKLSNHVVWLVMSIILTGLATSWAVRDMLICGSATGPAVLTELLDYFTGV